MARRSPSPERHRYRPDGGKWEPIMLEPNTQTIELNLRRSWTAPISPGWGALAFHAPTSTGCACISWRPASETDGRPCVLLLHGFPELAYSWRKVMPSAGRCRLPCRRPGPARPMAAPPAGTPTTTPMPTCGSFRSLLNAVRGSAKWLVHALGYRSVAAVVGHDFGSAGRRVVRACCVPMCSAQWR